MVRENMTSRERWSAVLKREKPDRLVMDYWATGEVDIKLMEYTKCQTMREFFNLYHIDRPIIIGPAYIGPALESNTDMYGLKGRNVNYKDGVYYETINHPLAEYTSVEEIDSKYTWPSIDWFDFSVIKKQLEGNEKYPVQGGGSEPFLVYKMLRGDEQAFIDMVEEPEIVEYCLGKMFDLAYEHTSRILEEANGAVTYVYVAEDMGSETSLMYSPVQIKKFLLPGMKRMARLAHQAGAYVFHHNDGAVRAVIPDLIDTVGIDILNPIQYNCSGMDRQELKDNFGNKIIFHGAMDNQYTMPFGSVEEVKALVRENIDILGRNGGYILAPCHNLQPITPVENILALYEEGYLN
ncbi:MAG: hypothetical protein LBI03_03080 [Clostridiales bacterium]|jgi:uroporphyrinogen decarboxylase|nr:hypothetical protein [Clostridiales bacterium]